MRYSSPSTSSTWLRPGVVNGSDYLTGGSNSARLEGGKGDDILLGGPFPD